MPRALLILWLIVPCAVWAIDVGSIEALRTKAATELHAGDFAQARITYETLLREIPEHPEMQVSLARSLVGLGQLSEAEAIYQDIVNEGFGAILTDDAAFARLAGRPGYAALRARASAQGAPRAPARVAFEIPEQKFIAEGLAFDPHSGRFFVSSTYLRKILVREPDGHLADFVASADHGLLQALGIKVDSARSRLVVVTATDDARLIDFKSTDVGRSGVLSYDLSTGRMLQAIWLPAHGKHLFNDLVLTADGTAYITDSDEGSIYRLSADGRKLTAITRPRALLYPNGIDIDPSKRRLFVADVRGVYTVDLDTGSVEPMRHAKAVSAVELDGLYLHGSDLIGVQSIRRLNRIVAYHLSRDHSQILSAEPLDSADPRLSAPTEGVIVGDELYFIANSFQDAPDDRGVIAAPERTAPTPILMLHLPKLP